MVPSLSLLSTFLVGRRITLLFVSRGKLLEGIMFELVLTHLGGDAVLVASL